MSPSNLASVLMKLATAPDESPVGEGKWQVTENGRGKNDYTPAGATQMVRKCVLWERDVVDQSRLHGGGRGITVFSISFC